MRYFFVLGKNPTLSFAEIAVVLSLKPEQVLYLSKEAAVVETEDEIDAQSLIRKLGGTIKIGVVNAQLSIINAQSIFNEKIFNDARNDRKFNFGFSYYGEGKLEDEKQLAMEIKKTLKEKGVSSRWVTSREKVLSSVVVEQNKLTGERGVEVVIIKNENNFFTGKTLAVQPFKELSARDYGRPMRDDYSGMLPPKIALIMLNLSIDTGTDKHGLITDEYRSQITLLDPFCGSGTILTEAALMGFKNLIGCDKSEKAVSDTKQNLEWIAKQYPRPTAQAGAAISNIPASPAGRQYQIFQCDVQRLSSKIKLNSVAAIVTEPYLGPARGKRNLVAMEKIARELEQLYHQAILQFEKVLQPQGRVVMIWPVFVLARNEKMFLNTKNILKNSSFQKVNPLQGFNNKVLRLSDRGTLLYGREGQKIEREILILEKK